MDGRLQNLRQMLEAKKAGGTGGVKYGRRSQKMASTARRDKGRIGRKGGGRSVRLGLNWVLMKRKKEEGRRESIGVFALRQVTLG